MESCNLKADNVGRVSNAQGEGSQGFDLTLFQTFFYIQFTA